MVDIPPFELSATFRSEKISRHDNQTFWDITFRIPVALEDLSRLRLEKDLPYKLSILPMQTELPLEE